MSGQILGATLGMSVAFALTASAVEVNFDDVTGSLTGTLYPANQYLASSGIAITSANAPDSFSVGSLITLTDITPDFLIFQNTEAVSGFNTAGASQNSGGSKDLLMSFSTPVNAFSLRTDHAVENQDFVRLIALASTGTPNQYQVVAFVNGVDDATSAPADTLTLTLAQTGVAFSYVLFQSLTDSEAVDNLSYTFVPEPGTASLLGCAALGLAMRRRRK